MLKLQGYSGCYLNYLDKRVRKGTQSVGYLDRLKRQAQKQTEFIELNAPIGNIDIPRVMITEEGDDYYWFEMPYVAGLSGPEFLRQATKDELEWLINEVATFIHGNLVHSQLASLPSALFADKLSELEKKDGSSAIKAVRKVFETLPSDIQIPVGPCHGDLTLSNMIIDLLSKKVWLIDFLDQIIDTPLWDIAKVRQDTAHHWLYFCITEPFDRAKMDISLGYLDRLFDQSFNKFDWYQKGYKFFQLLNLARILPYAKEKEKREHLERNIQELAQR